MSVTLVTFLGRGQQDRKTSSWAYRETTYKFPGGRKYKTSFFGLALAKHIHPRRVVILGTSGSQWWSLASSSENENDGNKLLDLLQAEEDQKVNCRILNDCRKFIERTVCAAAPGAAVALRLIPWGKDESEQYEILQTIADAVPDGEACIDLTHGFRHLGMIGFLSSFMLERVRNLSVKSLWYGAVDMTEGGITPVLKLDGLVGVRNWIRALDRFHASRDYGVFVDLLKRDGVAADHLKKAAFFERTHNLTGAADQIEDFKNNTGGTCLPGVSGLFQKDLYQCLSWAAWGDVSKQQGELARQYLERRDYLRAALFGTETLVTRWCSKTGVTRSRGKTELNKYYSTPPAAYTHYAKPSAAHRRDYWTLNAIRNALTHGPPRKLRA